MSDNVVYTTKYINSRNTTESKKNKCMQLNNMHIMVSSIA